MDTSDPGITFNHEGICSHCLAYDEKMKSSNPISEVNHLIHKIKKEGKNKKYDCLIGMSGGVDSSYVAYLCHQHGLRPLVLHVDTGWDSELAVKNIEGLLKKLSFDLETIVIDWEEMRSLQLSYFKASVANLDVPSDHAILASLFKIANKYGIKYILSGSNLATEFILPKAWGHSNRDLVNLKSINQSFGKSRLKSYPKLGVVREAYFRTVKKIKLVNLLDYVEYNKEEAMKLLQACAGWRDYLGKHFESKFTEFFQSYYLPKKFGYDKRRAHLSSLIISNQISREEALNIMNTPPYVDEVLSPKKAYIAKKLGLNPQELDEIIDLPPKDNTHYKTSTLLSKYSHHLIALKRKLSPTI